MAEKVKKKKPKRRRVTFTLEAPKANKVILMGDFNKWDAQIHPMKKNRSGVWEKITMLLPGRYEYRFLVDGQWWNDPKNDQVCPNCFGTQNNVMVIS